MPPLVPSAATNWCSILPSPNPSSNASFFIHYWNRNVCVCVKTPIKMMTFTYRIHAITHEPRRALLVAWSQHDPLSMTKKKTTKRSTRPGLYVTAVVVGVLESVCWLSYGGANIFWHTQTECMSVFAFAKNKPTVCTLYTFVVCLN